MTNEELKRIFEAIVHQQAELGDYNESADRLARALAHALGLDNWLEMYFYGGPIELPSVNRYPVLVQPSENFTAEIE